MGAIHIGQVGNKVAGTGTEARVSPRGTGSDRSPATSHTAGPHQLGDRGSTSVPVQSQESVSKFYRYRGKGQFEPKQPPPTTPPPQRQGSVCEVPAVTFTHHLSQYRAISLVLYRYRGKGIVVIPQRIGRVTSCHQLHCSAVATMCKMERALARTRDCSHPTMYWQSHVLPSATLQCRSYYVYDGTGTCTYESHVLPSATLQCRSYYVYDGTGTCTYESHVLPSATLQCRSYYVYDGTGTCTYESHVLPSATLQCRSYYVYDGTGTCTYESHVLPSATLQCRSYYVYDGMGTCTYEVK
ncbi:hypothetical protein J6590_100899 [Homalodisca vitripennis]|nr:hypothetical protein J6590_100899 [Homalodisca vitripennis]